MGADINIYAEVRRAGRWELAEPLQKNSLWSEGFTELGSEWKPRELYDDRCYELFAILANVRNPIRAVAPFDYISEPRGLPDDISIQLLDWYTIWGSDAFAESWLLLDELLAFDWHGKQIVRRGMVDRAVAHLFPPARRGFPPASEWPNGQISVADQSNRPEAVEVKWIDTYAEAVGNAFLVDAMKMLRSYGPPRDVRVVFWFSQ